MKFLHGNVIIDMNALSREIVFITLFLVQSAFVAQQNQFVIYGRVISGNEKVPVNGAVVHLSNSQFSSVSSKEGFFRLPVPKKGLLKVYCRHLSYETRLREIRPEEGADSLQIDFNLTLKPLLLDTVSAVAIQGPETLVGKPNYGIYDFDFYEDKLLLLTSEGSLKKAQVQLADYNGKVLAGYQLPPEAGEAKHFYHDYEGYTDVVCSDTVFRLEVLNNSLLLMTVKKSDFEKYLKPVSDTVNGYYYFTNYWDKYPSFNHYAIKAGDSVATLLKSISNADLLKLYNLEYYYLPSRMQLEARRMAEFYKTDVHIVAALMSGFTGSMFYEPLYAPLFVINDTICIFNHHNDHLYHYSKDNQLTDSVKINYHHPKNWREWKKKLYVDEDQNKVYAFFSKNGHHYLKQINYRNGEVALTYKLQHHSAEKIKIKNGYIYYVYRPFGSTQEKFLYRERIVNSE